MKNPKKSPSQLKTSVMVALPTESRPELDRLIKLLTAEKGTPIPGNRALAIAIREALAARKKV